MHARLARRILAGRACGSASASSVNCQAVAVTHTRRIIFSFGRRLSFWLCCTKMRFAPPSASRVFVARQVTASRTTRRCRAAACPAISFFNSA